MSELQVAPPPIRKQAYSSRTRWLTNLGLLLVILFFALPFLWIVAAAFDNDAGKFVPWPNEPTLDNFRYLFDERDVAHALRNSLLVSISAMTIATVLASLAGFALSRLRFRYKIYAVYAVLLLYAIPIAATMVAIYDLADRLDLIDTFYGLILAQTAMILPFLIWLMKGFFDGLPRYLDEAAAIDGRSTWRAWWDILMPLSKTGLAITAGFAFTAAWSEVLLVIIMITQQDKATLPLQFFFAAEGRGNAEVTAALGVLYLAPVVLLFLFLRRWMVRSLISSTRGL
ncbi:MAG: carbohydrate ABC transporter permease [Thermomicrobiales bacterium]|nr:carbohydrate ABC transporter permease [Thermomicrobiales bacterium]